jgi:hypothetical protein
VHEVLGVEDLRHILVREHIYIPENTFIYRACNTATESARLSAKEVFKGEHHVLKRQSAIICTT